MSATDLTDHPFGLHHLPYGAFSLPGDAVLVTIIRDGVARAPERDAALEGSDELLFVVDAEYEGALAQYLVPRAASKS